VTGHVFRFWPCSGISSVSDKRYKANFDHRSMVAAYFHELPGGERGVRARRRQVDRPGGVGAGRVEYTLTRLGRSLLDPLSELGSWARCNRAAIQEARKRFDVEEARR
jgi:hypothetical protein